MEKLSQSTRVRYEIWPSDWEEGQKVVSAEHLHRCRKHVGTRDAPPALRYLRLNNVGWLGTVRFSEQSMSEFWADMASENGLSRSARYKELLSIEGSR